jgi:Domain of unknown function (DUF1905)
MLRIEFSGEIWHWRGPAPFHFVTVPEDGSVQLHAIGPAGSYGWGMIPVSARIGRTVFETALIPRNGRYAVPLKDVVRAAEDLAVGEVVSIELTVRT